MLAEGDEISLYLSDADRAVQHQESDDHKKSKTDVHHRMRTRTYSRVSKPFGLLTHGDSVEKCRNWRIRSKII